MERDGSFSSFNWQSNSHNSSLPMVEMNGSSCDGNANMGDQSSGVLNLNWDQSSTEQTANFESALSSLVSSPTSSNPNPNPNPSPTPDSVVIRELIGRLGSICSNNNNRGEEQSTNTSCYSTPLNSPPKLNLLSMMDHPQLQLPRPCKTSFNPVPFTADPGFAERAARFSCFGAARSNYAQFGPQEPGKLSRESSSQSLNGMATSYNGKDDGVGGGQLENDMMLTMMMRSGSGNNNSQQESSPPSGSEANVKKRKSSTASSSKGSNTGRSGAKEAPHPNPSKGAEDNSYPKRSRSSSAAVEARANNRDDDARKTQKAINITEHAQKQEEDDKDKDKDKENNNEKLQESPKQDYIHVRARRGQATDSHSLAERVRREKISERMKFLQDLVPGCNKVIGKAVMLDEIINYVQSLQRQVEFLSMKLATVNPRLDFSMDRLLHKDMNQSPYPLEVASTGFSYANQAKGQEHPPPLQSNRFMASNGLETQCSVNNSLDSNSLLSRCLSMHLPPLDSFTDAVPASQLGAFWEDDLQSVVQMGFGQIQEATFSSHSFQGPLFHKPHEN